MLRGVLRFLASVLMVSGTLLIADAGATLLWQEPVSWLLVQRQQSHLEQALASPPRRVIEQHPLPGDAVGRILIPRIGLKRYVVEGTALGDLRKGPGHYRGTPLPGQRGTVAIAGHRTTYGAPFRHVDQLRRGDRIMLDTPRGRFLYRVQTTRIVPPTALWVTRRRSYDRLVLSACHPLYSAAQRIVVFARSLGRRPGSTVKRRS